MSDYISKSDVIKIIEKETKRTNSIIEHNTQLHIKIAVEKLPTLSETEIIRKAFERVLKRAKASGYKEEVNDCDPFGDIPNYVVSLSALKIILKEECGISE